MMPYESCRRQMCTLDKKKKAYKLLIYKDSCCNYMNQVVVIFMLHI